MGVSYNHIRLWMIFKCQWLLISGELYRSGHSMLLFAVQMHHVATESLSCTAFLTWCLARRPTFCEQCWRWYIIFCVTPASLSLPSSLPLSPSFSPPLIKVKDKDSKWWQLWHHIHYNTISSSLSPPLLFNSPILVIKIGNFPHKPSDLFMFQLIVFFFMYISLTPIRILNKLISVCLSFP